VRCPNLRGLHRTVRWLRGRSAEWVVLLYHRVTVLRRDPWGLAVTPEHFEEHLDVIRRCGRPTTLVDLDEMLKRRERPRRAVIVTFDDGYADNLYEARPLLDQYEIPATVFVTTGPLTHARGFWWDELEHALLSPSVTPATLRLTVGGQQREWALGGASASSNRLAERWRAWREPPTARHACYYELWRLLHRASDAERWSVLDTLRAWVGIDSTTRPTHRTMSAAELAELATTGLVEIGAHAVSHSALSSLTPSAQREEICRSKQDLEDITGRQVSSFAYPFGRRADYTADTVAYIREAGFARACSVIGERLGREFDQFQIPRVHVDDLDGAAFERLLMDSLDA